jgi:hypothetical protein
MGGASSRQRSVDGFRAARADLDVFNPDFILIFGDDQYENFREPRAFAVFNPPLARAAE